MHTNDTFTLGGHEFSSRFILGSGKFSLDLVKACIEKADAQIITLALRRANEGGVANILDYIPDNVTLLPTLSFSSFCKGVFLFCICIILQLFPGHCQSSHLPSCQKNSRRGVSFSLRLRFVKFLWKSLPALAAGLGDGAGGESQKDKIFKPV